MGTDDFPTRPGARRRTLAVALAAGCVVAVVAALVLHGRSPAGPAAAAPIPGTVAEATGTVAATATAATASGGHRLQAADLWREAGITDDLPVDATPATLPRGTRTVGTWRLDYPRTTSGAVAAAVEYVSHSGCLTPTCVDDLLAHAFSPAWTGARAKVTGGMRDNRRELGIPDGSPVPAAATAAISPMAYQLDTDPREGHESALTPQVRVVLLCYQGIAGPAIAPANRILVIPATLRWDGTTFKIVPGDRSYNTQLGARPGTPAARALGWRDFIA